MHRKFGFALIVMMVVSVAGWAQDVQTGRWTLNLAKSHFKTSPAPKTQIVTIVAAGKDGLKVTADVVRANGAKAAFAYAAQYDGKEYPRTETGDGAVAGQTVTMKRLDDRTVERITYLKGKKLVIEKWEISRDGKTRTVTQSGVGPDGKPVDNVLLYEK
jgi:tRNA(Ile2) C34 agmatinyltransferase TiaS